MINTFIKFQEFAKNLKASSTKEISETNNKTTEEINDKDNNIIIDEGKNRVQYFDVDSLEEIYEKFKDLETEIDLNFEMIGKKIEEIKYSKAPLSIEKEDSTISNFIFNFDKALSFETDELRDLKFQP